MHANAFSIGELSFTGSGNLENPIYSLQKNVLQFMSRETRTPTHTVTGTTSFALQVAIEFVNWQPNLSEEGVLVLVGMKLIFFIVACIVAEQSLPWKRRGIV